MLKMNKKYKSLGYKLRYIVPSLSIFILFLSLIRFSYGDFIPRSYQHECSSSVNTMSDGWEYSYDDNMEKFKTELPTDLHLPKGTTKLRLYGTIPQDVKTGYQLRMYTRWTQVVVRVNSRQICSYGNVYDTVKKFTYTSAPTLIIGDLTEQDAGMPVTIDISTIPRYTNQLNSIMAPSVATSESFIKEMYQDNIWNFTLLLALAIFAFVTLFEGIVFYKNKKQDMLYSFFASFLAIDLVGLFNSSNYSIYEMIAKIEYTPSSNQLLTYICEATIPLLCYCIVCKDKFYKTPKHIKLGMHAQGILFVIEVFLHVTWIVPIDYFRWINFGFSCIILISILIDIARNYHKIENPYGMISIFIISITYIVKFMQNVIYSIPIEKINSCYSSLQGPLSYFLGLCIACFIIIQLIFQFKQIVDDKQSIKTELRMADIAITRGEQQYHNLLNNMNELREVKHDIKHHVNIISSMCQQGKYDELTKYIEEINSSSVMTSVPAYTNNYVINNILGFYEALAKKNNIEFRVVAKIISEIHISNSHIAVLLGNGLQNAVDANMALDKGADRFIEVRISQKGENLIFIISNRYNGKLNKVGKGLTTSKPEPGHGFGLKSIERIVEMYDGYYNIQYTNNQFNLYVVVNSNKSKKIDNSMQ